MACNHRNDLKHSSSPGDTERYDCDLDADSHKSGDQIMHLESITVQRIQNPRRFCSRSFVTAFFG